MVCPIQKSLYGWASIIQHCHPDETRVKGEVVHKLGSKPEPPSSKSTAPSTKPRLHLQANDAMEERWPSFRTSDSD